MQREFIGQLLNPDETGIYKCNAWDGFKKTRHDVKFKARSVKRSLPNMARESLKARPGQR